MSFARADNQSVTVYTLASGRGRSLPSYADNTTQLAFSPDDRTLLSNGSSTPRLWNLQTWKRLPSVLPSNTGIDVRGVAWQGTNILSATGVGAMTLTPQGKQLTVYALPQPSITAAAFSRDTHLLALAADDGWISLYDLNANQLRWRVDASGVTSLQFSQTGTTLVSGDATSEQLRFWSVKTGQALGPSVVGARDIAGFTKRDAAVVMGGRVVPLAPLLRRHGEVFLGELPGQVYRSSNSETAQLTPGGNSVCETTLVFQSGGAGLRTSSWQLAGLERNNFSFSLPEERRLGAVSADCRVLAVAASELERGQTPKPLAVEVYHPATGKKLQTWPTLGRVKALAVSPDGQQVAYLEEGSTQLVLGNVNSGQRKLWTLPEVVQDLESFPLVFRADGRALLIGIGTTAGTSFTVLNVP
ncbi:WD40 repeat domain-containing protein (plasmid) [Deinococcus sp. KNUC1210]|uniref:WD40 repeat domain-containing protein n=1 Tax=Deinococcus sp. KNUC1210 TaxID=2917691 RepID=UPI001EEFBFD1|nr:WD40 repeat domain-containing protein [Deinococcus sp. KNUC1210]ULH18304.1 WD40 repeat domain-containing protein [Deinococcus sp. KNUC1210]